MNCQSKLARIINRQCQIWVGILDYLLILPLSFQSKRIWIIELTVSFEWLHGLTIFANFPYLRFNWRQNNQKQTSREQKWKRLHLNLMALTMKKWKLIICFYAQINSLVTFVTEIHSVAHDNAVLFRMKHFLSFEL